MNSVVKEAQQQQVTSEALDPRKLQELVDKLQANIDQVSADPYQVGFRMDDQTDETIIEIKDPDGRVVKQFPPEKVLNLQHKLDELSGMVIDRMT